MNTYIILPLKFTAPVHFGDASGGGGLDAVQPICRADTFFSALCSEAARLGGQMLRKSLFLTYFPGFGEMGFMNGIFPSL